ncbi:MAG: tetratricopeptide repeat protein [Kordia sp.]|uniref:tetratricopeptide repeat protein n=1 Tax=Kordia sp. TaxID=1965332 RepID=UPI00385FC11B
MYHAYKNKKDKFWYYLIMMLPLVGALIYLLTEVLNKRDLEKVTEEIAIVINPSKKVKDAEKKLAFADTFQNRVALADAHYENGDYENASIHYEVVLKGNFEKDFYVISQLISAKSQAQQYKEVIRLAEKVKDTFDFKNSKAQYNYGLALDKLGRVAEAEEHLKTIDQRYSNYAERYTLAQFYHKNGKTSKATEILDEIISESEHMSSHNRRMYRHVVINVKKFREEL